MIRLNLYKILPQIFKKIKKKRRILSNFGVFLVKYI